MDSKFKHSKNRWLTKGLFYEASGYDIEFAQFTLDDEDKEVKGKNRPGHKDRICISSQNIIEGKRDYAEVGDKKNFPE